MKQLHSNISLRPADLSNMDADSFMTDPKATSTATMKSSATGASVNASSKSADKPTSTKPPTNSSGAAGRVRSECAAGEQRLRVEGCKTYNECTGNDEPISAKDYCQKPRSEEADAICAGAEKC